MINYIIPGAFELYDINFKILNLFKTRKELFYDNINISAVYGNPQFCIWDGGRIFKDYNYMDLNEVKKIINTYNNDFNIPIRYVFTNNILKKEHYDDRFCNLLMKSGSNYNNEVVIADDDFMYFLKNKYPTYNFISSTTKCLMNKDEIKEELNKDYYKMVCLDYNLNFNLNFLKNLSEKEKEKVEFLINPICPSACKHRKDHYFLNSVFSLNYGKKYRMEYCPIKGNTFLKETKKNHLTYDKIIENYEPLGFKNFKIEGRTWSSLDLILTYCEYMIKPEYYTYVITLLTT